MTLRKMDENEAHQVLTGGDTLAHGSSQKEWWQSVSFKIYSSHILSSWGDRMWSFAVGLYLVILYPESLLVMIL